ncbi:S-adenosyl-L-methionine-dependent methyltransferase [Xylariaceae sp. FL0016]|nr:S-adenosyl-L-methionine-dependent methyltransferase [Xylariaceae sp. FL0016]
MVSSRSLPELAHLVQSRTNTLYDLFNRAELPQPSFGRKAPKQPSRLPNAIEDTRAELLESLDELKALVLGPSSHVFFLTFLGPTFAATLHVLYKYRIAQNVPLDSAVSFKELAGRCGLTESNTKRYVRAAVSIRIFEEFPEGFVRHNAASAELATTILDDWTGFATEDLAPCAPKVVEALQKHPEASDPTKTPFAIAHGGEVTQDTFAILSKDTGRIERLSKAMSFAFSVPEMQQSHFVDNVPWSSNEADATCPRLVIDVGGSEGVLCEALLRKYPGINKAIVQDLPEVVAPFQEKVPVDLTGRIEYQGYSFFTEQTVTADVYTFRSVFHDWGDDHALQILRNQIPALRPGARILINERCLGIPGPRNHVISQFAMASDIMMQLAGNAKERSAADWTALLAEADTRFQIKSIVTPPHSALSIIEVVWEEDAKDAATLVKETPAQEVVNEPVSMTPNAIHEVSI